MIYHHFSRWLHPKPIESLVQRHFQIIWDELIFMMTCFSEYSKVINDWQIVFWRIPSLIMGLYKAKYNFGNLSNNLESNKVDDRLRKPLVID